MKLQGTKLAEFRDTKFLVERLQEAFEGVHLCINHFSESLYFKIGYFDVYPNGPDEAKVLELSLCKETWFDGDLVACFPDTEEGVEALIKRIKTHDPKTYEFIPLEK